MIKPKKYLKTILLLLACILIFTTCKKYPEDGHLSLQTVKHRLTKHDWFLSKYIIEDRDSTISHMNFFTTYSATNPRDLHFTIKPFAFGTDGTAIVLFQPGQQLGYSSFSLRGKKRDVYIEFLYVNFHRISFFGEGDHEWVIRKLTKTDFIIESEFNNIKYRVELKS